MYSGTVYEVRIIKMNVSDAIKTRGRYHSKLNIMYLRKWEMYGGTVYKIRIIKMNVSDAAKPRGRYHSKLNIIYLRK